MSVERISSLIAKVARREAELSELKNFAVTLPHWFSLTFEKSPPFPSLHASSHYKAPITAIYLRVGGVYFTKPSTLAVKLTRLCSSFDLVHLLGLVGDEEVGDIARELMRYCHGTD